MLEGLALAALIERCMPGQPAAPLAAIVRRASSGEPLVIGITQNGKPVTIIAPSKQDAITFVAEARVAGQHVRVGLAGLDTRDLDQLGLSLADAFEPCANLRGAARRLSRTASTPKSAQTDKPAAEPLRSPLSPARVIDQPESAPEASSPSAPGHRVRDWDVYGQARVSASIVYAAPD